MKEKYEDILYLPYSGSQSKKRMSMTERGAQFSPFAALTGFDAAICETGRKTEAYIDKESDTVEILNRKLRLLWEYQKDQPEVSIVCFRPDGRKTGGRYLTETGSVKKVDPIEGSIYFTDGRIIPFADIYEISGEFLKEI